MTETTTVIFRKWRNNKGYLGDGIIALFPYEPGDTTGLMLGSYMHIGQHGQASPNVIDWTLPAAPEEYSALKRELETLPEPYVLRVVRRTPKDAADVRWQAARR